MNITPPFSNYSLLFKEEPFKKLEKPPSFSYK